MRYLLDTHVLFWWITNDARLSPQHKALIASSGNEIYVSAVSAWEMAVKFKIGKWPEVGPLLPDVTAKVIAEGFLPLDITLQQAERAGLLDLVHRDPFDRVLAAQALDLQIAVLTVDPALRLLGCDLV